jgi:hypothetical protein
MLLILPLAAAPSLAAGNANFVLGARALGGDPWEEVENQAVFGVTVDFGPASWPVSLAAGYYLSTAEEEGIDVAGFTSGDYRGTVAEFSFGVRKTWKLGEGARVYVEGGGSSVLADVQLEGSSADIEDNDTSVGVYGQGGIFWRIGSAFNIGVDVRALAGTDVELTDFAEFGEGDADYVQIGMILGWGWPSE